eukprot:TRINITY_DN11547_c0_g1_i1.p1 TRINITY_DN11547_c0_g1~~TRINITY_DN11547_c0_g1_i1.p1  ORF type:complete len:219 (+),score=58.71 TRINITY_DN11547_c0_g1_i1:56-712(+)
MTYYHFLNCVAVAFLPYFVTYKASHLSEYGAIRAVLIGVFGYLITQMIQLVIQSSIISTESAVFNLTQEALKFLIGLVSVSGMAMSLTRVKDKETRVLGVGLGWGLGECIARRVVPLYLMASGYDWSVQHLLVALDSLPVLLLSLALAALVTLSNRRLVQVTPVRVGLALVLLTGPLFSYLAHVTVLAEWQLTAVRMSYALVTALYTRHLWQSAPRSQ